MLCSFLPSNLPSSHFAASLRVIFAVVNELVFTILILYNAHFDSILYHQLLDAAGNGRADVVIALLAEGADIERKDEVRSLLLGSLYYGLADRVALH